MRIAHVAVIAAAASMFAAGCGSTAQPAASSAQGTGSAAALAATLSKGYDADYDQLASPRQAIERSDLIVRGTVTEVFDGVSVDYPDEQRTARGRGTFVTLRVSVAEVISGALPPAGDGSVFVQVRKSPIVSTADVAAASANSPTVAILENITQWTPSEGSSLARPARMPATAPIFFAYLDGLWLQDAADDAMTGVGADRDELGAEWENPRTLDDLAAKIKSAC